MNKSHKLGWIATAALLGAALVAPSAVFAIEGHQSGQAIAWNDPDFAGSAEECAGLKLAPGEVYWHFIQNQLPEGTQGGQLSGTITAGPFGPVDNYKLTGGNLHWAVITGHTTLLTFSSNVGGDGQLNLSHICVGPDEEESASVPVESESIPVESASVPVESESIPVESASIPVESASIPVESASIPVESASIPVESASIPVESASIPVESENPSGSIDAESNPPSDGPSGSVDAETGTPEITPPSTDGISGDSGSTPGSSWQLLLVALAAILATALIVTPASRKTRR